MISLNHAEFFETMQSKDELWRKLNNSIHFHFLISDLLKIPLTHFSLRFDCSFIFRVDILNVIITKEDVVQDEDETNRGKRVFEQLKLGKDREAGS